MSTSIGLATDGLTADEVEQRRERGQVNTQPSRTSRSYLGIVRTNVLTRFNAIIASLAVVVLLVGHPIDAIFAGVMIVNSVVGITQEVRAKRTLDRLRVLIAPTVTARRDGKPVSVDAADLVVDDVIELRSGDEVPVDGVVVGTTALDVDESALTGESDAITKRTGDEVRSGSIVTGGAAVVRATAVGEDAWIHGLVAEAKQFVLTDSELRRGVDAILRVVGWAIVPLAALLTWSQLRADGLDIGDDIGPALVSAVAGVVGLVPQGLVLLVSVALAVGVLRLARQQVVVQELHAVEGLARVDVLCLDKTGTLTTGAMTRERIERVAGADPAAAQAAIAALAAAEPTPTATLTAAAEGLDRPDWEIDLHVVFNSARKWSGATFSDGTTWVIGAPEIVLGAIDDDGGVAARLGEFAQDARRVLLLARAESSRAGSSLDASDPVLPAGLRPAALVVLTEMIRPDAAEILGYFRDQDVTVKIISGDHPGTVATVAGRLGVPGAERFVDARTVDLDGPDAAELVADTTVFGRVLPHQKRRLVELLQAAGHTVAMTGDGVNDIPALKQADIGIGMDTATPATKAVSQLVLLDGRFDRLPGVVGEGRRVITNMERVSALFVTKTVYAAVFACVIGISVSAFPFLPRHLSLISEVTIGIPAFALSFRAAHARYRPGYLRRVLRFAVPAGLTAAAVTLVAYGTVRAGPFDVALAEARSVATLVLLTSALWVLWLLIRPVDRIDALVLGAMIVLAVVIVSTPLGRGFYAIDWPDWEIAAGVGAAVAVTLVALTVVATRWRVIHRGRGGFPPGRGR